MDEEVSEDPLSALERWRADGYGVMITGSGADARTGFAWVCSIFVSGQDMATGANDRLDSAIVAAIRQAEKRYHA